MYTFSYNSQIKCFRTHVDMDIFLVLVCGIRAQSLSAPFSYTLCSYTEKHWHLLIESGLMKYIGHFQ
jgi:hypothetical protein